MKRNNSFLICITILIIILTFVFWCFASRNVDAKEIKWVYKYINVKATAYCLCEQCTGKRIHDGKTSTNSNAYSPGIAVDPNIISYGSRIDCAEYERKPNWCKADDTGEAIKNYHIDLRVLLHEEAINFGIKKVKIRVWTQE